MAISQKNKTSTSSDYSSHILTPLSFESWIGFLGKKPWSPQECDWFLKGLHDHSEWLNHTDQSQRTPLIKASLCFNFEAVNALIQAGADLHLQDHDDLTVLIHASYLGQAEVVKLLISSGADLNHQERHGWTALMHASHQGYHEIVQLLISSGADLNVKNQAGWTALMMASYRGHVDVVQSLLHQGVDLDVDHNALKTAWNLAHNTGYDDVAFLLDAHASQLTLNQVIHPSFSSLKDNLPPSSKTTRL